MSDPLIQQADSTHERAPRPLLIVAYGYVHKEGGSVASASYLILERLLESGHAIEFHAIAGFIVPEGLIGRPGFTYVPTSIGLIHAGWGLIKKVPQRLRSGPAFAYSLVSNAVHERAIGRKIAARHAERPFDRLLVLGMLPPFRVPGLRCVCWPQGAPNGEWEALRSLKRRVVAAAGRIAYASLAALYAFKQGQARRRVHLADVVLCGSCWSVENWVRLGVPRPACHALPYPVALEVFRPDGPKAESPPGVTTFLWLGRIVPRKRLDLLLDAYAQLRRDRQDVRLLVIGRFAYARGLQKQLDRFGPGEGVEYRASIPRSEVPALLRSADVLVQPSENEDIGSSVLEALACGTLAIVGPTNGTRDYLSASSLVLDAYTPESLRDAMARAIAMLERDRTAISAEGRATAERLFSITAVVARVEAILAGSSTESAPS
jgi:glycosyltransferase involved in cell wall biosynthesis